MPRKKLTDVAAERTAPPEKGRLELWDTVTTGLCLRITSKNVRTWNFVYRIGGIQRRMTLGHFPAISVLKARGIAKKALEDIAVGVDPIAHRQDQIQQQIKREEDAISVERLSEEFIERYTPVKVYDVHLLINNAQCLLAPEDFLCLASDYPASNHIAWKYI